MLLKYNTILLHYLLHQRRQKAGISWMLTQLFPQIIKLIQNTYKEYIRKTNEKLFVVKKNRHIPLQLGLLSGSWSQHSWISFTRTGGQSWTEKWKKKILVKQSYLWHRWSQLIFGSLYNNLEIKWDFIKFTERSAVFTCQCTCHNLPKYNTYKKRKIIIFYYYFIINTIPIE